MISTKSKLAMALGVVGAIALSVPSAEARTKRSNAKDVQSTVTGVAGAPSGFQPSYRGSYNFEASPISGGINFRDGRNGANYNPNQ